MRDALLSLPPDNRRALIMHVWGCYPYAEIAGRLGIPLSTVEGRIHRAKAQLRRRLGYDERPQSRAPRVRGGMAMEQEGMRPALVPQLGHGSVVDDLAVSADGRYFASLGGNGTGIVWKLDTGEELQRLHHLGLPVEAAFSPDSRLLAVSDWGEEASVWDIASGRLLRTLPVHPRPIVFTAEGDLWTVSWTPDPEQDEWMVALAMRWNLATGEVAQRVEDMEGAPLLLSPDAATLITAGGLPTYDHGVFVGLREPTLLVWDLPAGQRRCTLTGIQGYPKPVALSPDGGLIAASAWDEKSPNDVLVWDAHSGELKQTLTGHQGRVTGLAFTPDGQSLLFCTKDGIIYRVELATGSVATVFTHEGQFKTIAFTPDGRRLIASAPALRSPAAFTSSEMLVFDLECGAIDQRIAQRVHILSTVALHPAGHTLATGGFERAVTCWQLPEGRLAARLELPENASVHTLAYHPDGRRLLGSVNTMPNEPDAQRTGQVFVWDARDGRLLRTLDEHTDFVYAVACSPDGRLAASCSYDNSVLVWDAAEWTVCRRYAYTEGWGSHKDLCFSPDSMLLASNSMRTTENRAYAGGALTLWDMCEDTVRFHWEEDAFGFQSPLLTPDGRLLLTAMTPIGKALVHELEIRAWEMGNGELRGRYAASGLYSWINQMALSPDGGLLVAATTNGYLLIWRTDGERPVASARQLPGYSALLAFSTDGRLLFPAAKTACC